MLDLTTQLSLPAPQYPLAALQVAMSLLGPVDSLFGRRGASSAAPAKVRSWRCLESLSIQYRPVSPPITLQSAERLTRPPTASAVRAPQAAPTMRKPKTASFEMDYVDDDDEDMEISAAPRKKGAKKGAGEGAKKKPKAACSKAAPAAAPAASGKSAMPGGGARRNAPVSASLSLIHI